MYNELFKLVKTLPSEYDLLQMERDALRVFHLYHSNDDDMDSIAACPCTGCRLHDRILELTALIRNIRHAA